MRKPAAPLLRVRDWDSRHENSRSRELERTLWLPVPNDLGEDSYVELVSHEDGAAYLGAWHALLMVASRGRPRGTLMREDGREHTAESLAVLTRLPKPVVEAAIERLLKIGLLETGAHKPRKKSQLGSHPSAGKSQAGAAESHPGAVEGKGIEHHHQEGKGTEKKRTRKESKGTERARDESPTEQSDASEGSPENPSHEGDDSDEPPGVRYASPEDELKAIYQSKTGEEIAIALLDAIRLDLDTNGATMAEYLAEVRKHLRGDWHNPPGFLRDRSKRFRARTVTAGPPVTAAEAAVRDYKCPLCHSRVPGEGAILRDGKYAPCTCAANEWVAAMRASGVFPPDGDQ
jgi:hypothetical protein